MSVHAVVLPADKPLTVLYPLLYNTGGMQATVTPDRCLGLHTAWEHSDFAGKS